MHSTLAQLERPTLSRLADDAALTARITVLIAPDLSR